MLLGGNLLLGEVFDGDGVDDGVDGFDAEFDGVQRDGLRRVDGDVLDLPGCEAGCADTDAVGAGGDRRQREGTAGVRCSGEKKCF